ncbi:sensor histidine kinase [Streptomyces sp. NPDC057910]|uniref:sensor histidine kinase n=1 Tax=Streptomyces sp. NPDC057910 TaxID=3346278 RepID=UPI0036EAF186
MRRRIALRVVLATLLSTAIFALPFALYVRDIYMQEAEIDPRARAQSLARAISLIPGDAKGLDDRLRRLISPTAGMTVYFPDGHTVGEASTPAPPGGRWAADRWSLIATRERLDPNASTESIVLPVTRSDGNQLVVTARIDPRPQLEAVHRAWLAIVTVLVLLPLCAAALTDRFGRNLSRQYDRLVRAATAMAGGDLSVRVAIAGTPELRRLGNSFNYLASRIDGRVQAEREAAADVSHRLRTPVAALMLQAQSLTDPQESAQILESARRLQREVSYIIERTRCPALDHQGAHSDLAAVARERVAFWEPLAEDQLRPCDFTVTGRGHTVGAPEEALAAAVDALLGNVFSHTPDGTALRVRVEGRGDSGVRLVVEDDGPGIDPTHLRRGASGSGSSGLGLDIVQRLAQSTGGNLSLSSPPGGGARVHVTFGARRSPSTTPCS